MFAQESLFRKTSLPAVTRSLDAGAMRSKAIADNLANVTTPGYGRIEVDFERKLRDALDRKKLNGLQTDAMHMDLGRPSLAKVNPTAYRVKDGTLPGEVNNVDVDIEATKLAENQILFEYGIKFVSERKGAIESAIKLTPNR